MNDDVKEELTFWVSCLDGINGQILWKTQAVVRVVYSDASSTGYAGFWLSMAIM